MLKGQDLATRFRALGQGGGAPVSLTVRELVYASEPLATPRLHRSNMLRIRLVAVGRDRSDDFARDYPEVIKLPWAEMLGFVWDRFHRYRRQKTQVDQWDQEGSKLKRLADEHRRSCEDFVERALGMMDVRHDDPAR